MCIFFFSHEINLRSNLWWWGNVMCDLRFVSKIILVLCLRYLQPWILNNYIISLKMIDRVEQKPHLPHEVHWHSHLICQRFYHQFILRWLPAIFEEKRKKKNEDWSLAYGFIIRLLWMPFKIWIENFIIIHNMCRFLFLFCLYLNVL